MSPLPSGPKKLLWMKDWFHLIDLPLTNAARASGADGLRRLLTPGLASARAWQRASGSGSPVAADLPFGQCQLPAAQ
jgi:hypothetical protein